MERKNYCKGIVNITTRGQFGESEDGLSAVKAMTGFQRKYQDQGFLRETLYEIVGDEENIDKYLPYTQVSSRPIPDVYTSGGQISMLYRENYYRVKYDNRRRIDPSINIVDENTKLYFSKPHPNPSSFIDFRGTDEMMKEKYRADTHFYPSGSTQQYVDKFIRTISRCLFQGEFGSEKLDYSASQMVALFREIIGVNINRKAMSNNISRPPVRWSIPNTREMRDMLAFFKNVVPHARGIRETLIFSRR